MSERRRPYGRKPPSKRGEVLVAIMNSPRDWDIVRERLWYRIPIISVPRRWPPEWLAFYQSKVFGQEAFAVRYFGKVKAIRTVGRRELFPDEPPNEKSARWYHQVFLESLEELPEPILNFGKRRLVFIPTTMYKLETAEQVNDLFDESPLEDALWTEMKRLELRAERQFYVEHEGAWFALDFAVFCHGGKLDVEADGDTWHAEPARIPEDNRRDNTLTAQGWRVLRFNGMQIRETMADDVVPQIVKTVNRLGGVADADRSYIPIREGIAQQYRLFESRAGFGEEEDD